MYASGTYLHLGTVSSGGILSTMHVFVSLLMNSPLHLSLENLFSGGHRKVFRKGIFLTIHFHPGSLSLGHCSWYISPGLSDLWNNLLMHWDATKFIFVQMKDERQGLVRRKLWVWGSFSENTYHILCGKLWYWRWWSILQQNSLHWTWL